MRTSGWNGLDVAEAATTEGTEDAPANLEASRR
jgi:hypothetical protein